MERPLKLQKTKFLIKILYKNKNIKLFKQIFL